MDTKSDIMINRSTIVLVLRSEGDFKFRDVQLIVQHISANWQSEIKPRIICLWDTASEHYDLGNIEIIPLNNKYPGTWARMMLYSPEMEQYRPFLYVDLDTAIIRSLENIFALVKDESKFITLEDFWQKGKLATGLAWVPAKSAMISKIWEAWKKTGVRGKRMDYFLRNAIGNPDLYWQSLTSTIKDFKPHPGVLLKELPIDTDIVCFHGKPRIHDAEVAWVRDYVGYSHPVVNKKITVIIPYNRDRGWLQNAIDSVPDTVQLILSKGDGNWPQNFNKALAQAEGEYIKYLHEDDMLTENCIRDSVLALETQKVDFIHGNAIQINRDANKSDIWVPSVQSPTLSQLAKKNTIHSATTMYRREVFDKVGGFDESIKVKTFEEYEFNLRCLKAGLKLGYCGSSLAYYRRHPDQLIKSMRKVDRVKNKKETLKQYQS